MRHGDRPIVERIVELAEAAVRARSTAHRGRPGPSSPGLVRTLVVVPLDEGIEARLLLEQIGRRRLSGLLLEREMHALVPTVLLRVAGLDAFDADAEPEPPDREFAEAVERVRGGEGHAVVGANRAGVARSP